MHKSKLDWYKMSVSWTGFYLQFSVLWILKLWVWLHNSQGYLFIDNDYLVLNMEGCGDLRTEVEKDWEHWGSTWGLSPLKSAPTPTPAFFFTAKSAACYRPSNKYWILLVKNINTSYMNSNTNALYTIYFHIFCMTTISFW